MSFEKALEEHTKQDRESFTELKADIKELRADIAAMRSTLERSRGFIGGVIFVVSAVWAVIAIFGGSFIGWLKG